MCQVHTGAYVPLLAPGKTDFRLPPKKDYHVYIARSTYHYAYARQTPVNWKKQRKEKKIKERKGKKRQQKTKKEKGMTRKDKKARKDKKSKKRQDRKRKQGRGERKKCHTSRP